MRIIVVGGGIGGLALAAGLRRHEFDVAVFDRDLDPAATGGYHITLDGPAQSALQEVLPPEIFDRVLASASALRLRQRDAFWDRRGRLLGHGPDLSADPGVDIDRITLRLLLAEAVGDHLHLGRDVTSVGHTAAGAPTAWFDDSTSNSGDLLVGADGTHSLVARCLAGERTNAPAGIMGFSGKTRRDQLSPGEQRRLGRRSGFALGPHGTALYIGFLDPAGNAVLDAPGRRSAVTQDATYIWGAMFPDNVETNALRAKDGTTLRADLLARFHRQGWNRDALEVIARTDANSVAAYRFNAASSRAGDLARWPAGSITALGDAVHATPPTAGMGAGTAIQDAASLVAQLRQVRAGTITPAVAVSQFEAEMRLRGSRALTLAMRTIRWIRATETPIGAAITVTGAPVLAATRRLRPRLSN